MSSRKPTKLEGPRFPPLSIVRMLWKRKISVAAVWFTLSAAAIVVIQRLPAIYSAETLILVDSQKIPEKYVSSTVSGDVEDRLATIRQQILSSTRLKKIISDLDLYRVERKSMVEEEVLETMRKDITVTLERGSSGTRPNAFRIAYQGRDPAIVAQVANRMASLYIDENLKTREVQAEGTAEFIDAQLQEAKKKLDELESAVSRYKLQHNGELPGQEAALLGTMSRRQLEMESNRDALNRAESTKLILQNSISVEESAAAAAAAALAEASVPPVPVPRPPGANPVVNAPNPPRPPKPSDAIEAQIRTLRDRGYTDGHPDLKRLTAELERLKAAEALPVGTAPAPSPVVLQQAEAIPETPAGVRRPSTAQNLEALRSRERLMNLKSQLELIDQEIARRKADQQAIVSDMQQYQGRLERLPIREQEMAGVTRDYEITKANYKSLLDKRIAAEMATDLEHRQKAERFTILDPARTPEKPLKPNRPVYNSIAITFALLLGLVVGIGREMKQEVLLGEWELPEGVVVLGRLPVIEMTPAGNDAPPEPPRPKGSKAARVAVVTSALLSLVLAASVGWYFVSR